MTEEDKFTGLEIDCCNCGEKVRVEMGLGEYLFGQEDKKTECENCGAKILLERKEIGEADG